MKGKALARLHLSRLFIGAEIHLDQRNFPNCAARLTHPVGQELWTGQARKLVPTSFLEDLIISVCTDQCQSNFSFPFDSRRPTSSILSRYSVYSGFNRIWKVGADDKDGAECDAYITCTGRNEKGRLKCKKSLCRIWRLRVNDKDWSNKEDVTCIGKERVKVQMVSPLDLGNEDRWMISMCVCKEEFEAHKSVERNNFK